MTRVYHDYKDYIIYYKLQSGRFRVFDNMTEDIETFDLLDKKRHRYFLFKGYEASDEGLKEYAKDFNMWTYQLRHNKILIIDYTKYFTHYYAVSMTFERTTKILHDGRKERGEKLKSYYEDFDKITCKEDQWFDKCNNGGLIYCEPGTYQSYGYDFSSFYPFLLCHDDFLIPTKEGKEKILDNLPSIKKIKFGLYRVKILCDNNDFKKIFAFSKDDVYTNYSLKRAMEYQNKYNVKITLIQDGEPNAFLYKTKYLVNGKSIFGDWFNILMSLKKELPKNKLLKHLLSSCWGHLTQKNTIHKTLKEIEDEKLDVGMGDTCEWKILDYFYCETSEYYVLVNPKEPYKYPLRIKPFLTSLSRNIIGDVILRDIENVIRVHTDNCVFKVKKTFDDLPNLLKEDKTSGKIEWFNANSYTKYKRIRRFENYEINDRGDIKNITNGKILKQNVSEEGKKEVVLFNGEEKRTFDVDLLMMNYFKV
jgi:hypothetical protein